MLTIDSVLETAKETLEESGSYTPMAFIETDKGEIVAACLIFGDGEKKYAIEAIRTLVEKHNSKRYIVVFEAWYVLQDAKDYPVSIAPSQRKDRMECLIATEFVKPNMLKSIRVPFTKKKGKVVLEKEMSEDVGGDSRWNVFVDKEAFDEKSKIQEEKAIEKYLQGRAKHFAKKYQDRIFKKDGSPVEAEEAIKVFDEMMSEMKAEADATRKKIEANIRPEETKKKWKRKSKLKNKKKI